MKIKDVYIGSKRGHIITALLTIWFTFGLGNVAYAIVANKMQDRPSRQRWVAMAIVFFVAVFAFGATQPSDTTTAPQPVQKAPEATPAPVATPAPAAPVTYKSVSISELTDGSIIEGTNVTVTGTVMQNAGNGMYLIRDSNYNIVAVSTTQSVYEGNKITIKGEYFGPFTYTTVMGTSKTVPGIMGI